MSDEGKYIKCEICLMAFTSDEAFRNHSGAQHKTFTPDEARALWQAASRTPGSIASEPLESALAKLLPMAEADGARRKYIGNGCLWVQPAQDTGFIGKRCEKPECAPVPHGEHVGILRP